MNKPKEDLVGAKFNKLTVLFLSSEKSKDGRFLWNCKCECGSSEIVLASAKDLKQGRKKSCSCDKNKRLKPPIDLTGKKFNRLEVIVYANKRNSSGEFLWLCLCDCGNKTEVSTCDIKNGYVKSCGCLKGKNQFEDPKHLYQKHYHLYQRWKGIKKRCYNPNFEGSENYGDRGIKVCDAWKKFEPFLEWSLANGFDRSLQIDRIDSNGDYEPSNCRWVTPKENSSNKRNNRFITIDGEEQTSAEWARIAGVSKKTITDRIDRGWSGDELLLSERGREDIRKYKGTELTIQGKTKAFSQWADEIGISYATLRDRIETGWTDEELLMPKGYRRKKKICLD